MPRSFREKAFTDTTQSYDELHSSTVVVGGKLRLKSYFIFEISRIYVILQNIMKIYK